MIRKDGAELSWILSVIRHWLWLIVLCTLLGMAAAFIAASWMPPVYGTSAILLVSANSSARMSDYNTIAASERLVLTYSQMLTQRSVLEAVIKQLGLAETPETLVEKVKATPVKDTQLILLSVEDEDPVRAANIANTVAETFTAQIEKLRQANLQGDVRVTITQTAWMPEKPISRRALYVALAGLVSGMLVLGMAFLIEYLRDTINTPDDVSEAIGLSTIGAIGRLARGEQELTVVAERPSPIAEAFHTLCTHVRSSSTDSPPHTLLVTSPGPREGKSLITANLAAAMAQAGLKVIAADMDLRRPRLPQLFGLDLHAEGTASGAPWGLTGSLLEGHVDGRLISVCGGLKFLPSGELPPNPTATINSQHLRKLLQDLTRQTDMVLVDSPPVLPMADAAALAPAVDGVLLVLKAGRTPRAAARRAVENLRQAGGNVVGVVLNGVTAPRGGYYHYSHEYYREGKKPILQGIGDYLIVQDELHPSDVIHVIAGPDYRTDYAIRLYKEGFGRQLFFTGGWCTIHQGYHGEIGKVRALDQGVPPEAIAIDDTTVTSTYSEAVRLKEFIANSPRLIHSVTVVSDPFHMRRARWAYRRVFGDEIRLQMTPVPFASFPYPRRWWTDETSRRYVRDEYLKMAYDYLKYQLGGGPLQE